MSSSKIIFITGVSSGFGRALAQEAINHGHRVVGTVRSAEAKASFEALAPASAFARLLDVTDFTAIDGVIAEVEAAVGPIDVLVNNAGYGHEGVMEESSLDEMKRQFDVNVFGAVAMIKALLPLMRQRRDGRIHYPPRYCLLLWQQVCARRDFRDPESRVATFWHCGNGRRAGIVSHRLGGALNGEKSESHRRL
jgi:hypothetical protein